MTTAAATRTSTDPKVYAEIYELAVASIDPDPDQPRLEVDDELADSVKANGVLQAIEVRPHPEHADRWMIVDGERRWRGSRKAGKTTIPSTVTFDVEGVNIADRIMRQVVRNDGKRLNPVEEALAFKRAIDDRRAAGAKDYGPVQLARDYGLKKSTVTDRITLASLPKFWLELIRKGPLQPSHAPIINRWRGVPEEFQKRALRKMQDDYEWPGSANWKRSHPSNRSETIELHQLEEWFAHHLEQYVKPISDVGSTYKGPVGELTLGYGTRKKYAMDPAQWQPIVQQREIERKRKIAKESRERAKSAPAKKKKDGKVTRSIPRWLKSMIEAGAKRETPGAYTYSFDGEVLQVDAGKHAWTFPRNYQTGMQAFDPSVLMEQLQPAKIVVHVPKSGGYGNHAIRVCCKDASALKLARNAFDSAAAEAFSRILATLPAKVQKSARPVSGAGVRELLQIAIENDDRNDYVTLMLDDVGTALSLGGFDKLPGGRGSDARTKRVQKLVEELKAADLEALATAIATMRAAGIESPQRQYEAWEKKQLETYQAIQPKTWKGLDKKAPESGDEEVEDEDAAEGDDEE